MTQETKTMAYLCPHCHQSVMVERDTFALTAAPSHLPCPCGESELVIQPLENQMDLTVPCLFCGKEHRVACSQEAFFGEQTLAFSCAVSGLYCLYVGEEGAVSAALMRLEQAADQISEQAEQNGTFLNETIMEEMLGELRDIAARGGVHCQCGKDDWGLSVQYSAIELTCAHCGAMLHLPAATEEDLEDLCCRQTVTMVTAKGIMG